MTPRPTAVGTKDVEQPSLYAWFVFGVIFLLGFLDFAVRQMVVGIFPLLKADWGLDDKSMGALAAIVPIIVGISVVPTALLIDRWSRTKAIFLMALIWSLATIACGIANSYSQLFAARAFVGFGEAGYGPAGFALLAFYFPERMRASVIGGVLIAATLGSVVGIAAGGTLAERWGWQAAFLFAGTLSLAATFLFLFVRDYPTVSVVAKDNTKSQAAVVVRALLLSPTAVFCYFGGASQIFVISTLTVWLPSFFTRYHAMTSGQAALMGAAAVLIGTFGTLFWARLADRWSALEEKARLYIPAMGAGLTAVFLFPAFTLPVSAPMQIGLIMAAALAMTACYGPVNAVVMDVVQPGLRASATAMISLFQNILGLAAGPLVIGVISDRYGLAQALTVLPLFSILSVTSFLWASRTFVSDKAAIDHPA